MGFTPKRQWSSDCLKSKNNFMVFLRSIKKRELKIKEWKITCQVNANKINLNLNDQWDKFLMLRGKMQNLDWCEYMINNIAAL